MLGDATCLSNQSRVTGSGRYEQNQQSQTRLIIGSRPKLKRCVTLFTHKASPSILDLTGESIYQENTPYSHFALHFGR